MNARTVIIAAGAVVALAAPAAATAKLSPAEQWQKQLAAEQHEYDRRSMDDRWLRGRLREAGAAPDVGETVERLLDRNGVVVEQILSGALERPVDFRQEHDEWVVLVEGRATLVIAGEDVEL